VAVEHRAQGEAGEAEAHVGEEGAASGHGGAPRRRGGGEWGGVNRAPARVAPAGGGGAGPGGRSRGSAPGPGRKGPEARPSAVVGGRDSTCSNTAPMKASPAGSFPARRRAMPVVNSLLARASACWGRTDETRR